MRVGASLHLTTLIGGGWSSRRWRLTWTIVSQSFDKQQREYALEDTIKSLDFKGKVNELPDEIGKQGVPIAIPTWQSTHEQHDGSTMVYVKGEGLSVRTALSNFVKLEGRDRILWIARTKLELGAISYVFYPWPGPMGK